ncbi:hypothetical protein N3K66_007520 [Trichothecium roseum]|uniref:Uncharacterized protein n=1 Tax=Trichothecium roseum TaxID=47278 RepID=A0ACC0UU45_9HYPO|nr:hypothetical protein N3K66_007520 [Trichothecium roseum]
MPSDTHSHHRHRHRFGNDAGLITHGPGLAQRQQHQHQQRDILLRRLHHHEPRRRQQDQRRQQQHTQGHRRHIQHHAQQPRQQRDQRPEQQRPRHLHQQPRQHHRHPHNQEQQPPPPPQQQHHDSQPQPASIPSFDTTFFHPTPFFYFHHIVDPVRATLKVEVIGPNLTHTFTHSRAAKPSSSPSSSAAAAAAAATGGMGPGRTLPMLENKTVGFVALVRPERQNHPENSSSNTNTNSSNSNTRIVLGWAESGHGAGRSGDLLDTSPTSPVLPNRVWTRRVVRVGERCLGLNMARVFDSMGGYGRGLGTPRRRQALRGVFLGSHVEAKLALFGVCLLLRTFGLADDMDSVSARQLAALRRPDVVWEDGSRPVIEVYFSRKNCGPCGRFVEGLQRLTGIRVKLCWRDRLTKKVYGGEAVKKALAGGGTAAAAAAAAAVRPTEDGVVAGRDASGEVIVLEDAADHPAAIIIDGDDEDDCCVIDDIIDQVDLVADSSETGRGDEDDDGDEDEDDEDETAPTPAHAYADGLAYCVGQIGQEPRTARTAIVDLAERLLKRPRVRGTIDKPLPATPVTEFPGMLEPGPTPRFGMGRGMGTVPAPPPPSRGQRQARGGAVARMQGARRHTLGGSDVAESERGLGGGLGGWLGLGRIATSGSIL